MARQSALFAGAPAALLVLLAACGGGGSDDPAPPPPPPAPTATLALAPGSGSVQAGDAITTSVTLTRGGGFTGAVVIAVTGAPAGVTATAGTIAAGASTQVVNIITTNAAAAGTSMLSIGGTAAGVTIAPVSFALTVTAPPAAGAASVTVTAPAGSLLMEGSTVPLTATVRDAGGNVLAGQTVSWTSSNTGFATVSDAGVVSGSMAGGPVMITATSGGVSGQLQMRVAKDISSFVSEIRTARGMPAMGGAVVTRDGIAAIGVAGNRSVSGATAVTLSDKWHIGSNLKALTATLAAIAVKEGRISWDTKAIDSFPELAATLRPEFLTVTLRDLLAMRSGMEGNPPGNAYGGGTTARGQREWAAGWALSQAPVVARGSYFYSNLAYVTSSAMLERAFGGGNYEDLLSSKLALPSGAPSVGWGPQDAAGANPVGHTRSGGNWVTCASCDNPPGLSGAGRAHMPLADWSRIIAEVMKGDAGQSAVLDQTVLRETFTAHTPVGASDNYGLGWMVTTRPWGGRTVTHTGSNNSNHSVAWVGLDTGVAFLAVINAADHNAGATNTGAALDALVVRMLNWYQNGT